MNESGFESLQTTMYHQAFFPDLGGNNIEVKGQAMLAGYVISTEIKIILLGEHRNKR